MSDGFEVEHDNMVIDHLAKVKTTRRIRVHKLFFDIMSYEI